MKLLLFVALACIVSTFATTIDVVGDNVHTIKSDKVKATIDLKTCSLLTVTAAGIDETFTIVNEGFTLDMDNSTLYSTDLVDPMVSTNSMSVECVYTWAGKNDLGYTIQLKWETKMGWSFISKAMTIQTSNDTELLQLGWLNTSSELIVQSESSQQPFYWPLDPFGVFIRCYPKTLYDPKDSRRCNKWGDCMSDTEFTSQHEPAAAVLSTARATNQMQAGLMVAIQNAYQTWMLGAPTLSGGLYNSTLGYNADMPYSYDKVGAAYTTDRTIYAPYIMAPGDIPWGPTSLQSAEYKKYSEIVDQFLVTPIGKKTVKHHVTWTENFLTEMDLARPDNLAQAHRVIDLLQEIGVTNTLWVPRNTDVTSRKEATDAWDWGASLWLNMGNNISHNDWRPTDPGPHALPPSVQAILDYGKKHDVELSAYIYGSNEYDGGNWGFPVNGGTLTMSNLANFDYQNFLIKEMVAFADLSKMGGIGFDYTYFNNATSSQYAQWWGWRRIVSTTRSMRPNLIVDNRQDNHMWGPWMWVAGTYAEPIQSDEQPESWVSIVRDLHTARLTANRMRQMNFDYRYNKLCPMSTAPGFFSHQTEMTNITRIYAWDSNRYARDFDYHGYKFALIASVGTAGLNNVVNDLPARDEGEYEHFPQADKAFIKKWLQWTDDNIEILKHSVTLRYQPREDAVDGSAAIVNNTGYLFLYNPNAYELKPPMIGFNTSLNFDCSKTPTNLILEEIYPRSGNVAFAACGSVVELPAMSGRTAWGMRVRALTETGPVMVGVDGTVAITQTTLAITNARGEQGKSYSVRISVPSGSTIHKVTVNGNTLSSGKYFVVKGNVWIPSLTFSGPRFSRSQQIEGTQEDGLFIGKLTVPSAIIAQLKEVNKTYAVPWTNDDAEVTWLSPGRLLALIDSSAMSFDTVTATVDGKEWLVRPSWNCRGSHLEMCFIGFWMDLTLVEPDKEHVLIVNLPKHAALKGIFFDNAEPIFTGEIVV